MPALRTRTLPSPIAWVAAGALAAGALAAGPIDGAAAGSRHADPAAPLPGAASYINYVAPQFEEQVSTDVPVGGSLAARTAATAVDEAKAFDRKHAAGNPVAARMLARDEQRALQSAQNPGQFKQAPAQQEARLLTVLVEFDEAANDDFSGVRVPESVQGSRECVVNPPGTLLSGPLHNEIPDPATFGPGLDNNTFWVPDFSPEHFDRMLYSTEGLTDRVRLDLTGPDGQPGIDLAGYTMRNMYEEMSKGAYTVRGAATPWVKVEHSEAWYGADVCTQNAQGVWAAGPMQGMEGHPDNPAGPAALPLDAMQALVAQQPDFPFADYDLEDQGDLDGDGNVFEPDGVIDHLVLVHAGRDKSVGGGAEGTYAIWAHSSAVVGAPVIPGTDLRISNYIVQPEDSGVGVFAHEYGHDLGLPDLYDVASAGETDVDFWDLMASGSHSGPLFQTIPTHMGIWAKWVLGWADPAVLDPGDAERTLRVGQASRTPVGSEDGIRLPLPPKVVTITEPLSGTDMWWSGNDQNWARNTLTREVSVPAGDDVRLWMWNDYALETNFDFGFVEVSTDGGATWTELPVRTEDGTVVSTPADYPDPSGNLARFGDKQFGLTGSSAGWRHDYVDLQPYAGSTIRVRLLYATDRALLQRGWFVDSFTMTADGVEVFRDDVEGGPNGWTAEVGTFVPGTQLTEGWRLHTGTVERSHYYLAEWRTLDGFDAGLQYAYDTTYSLAGPWKVERLRYNAPGMLVWYRDTTYGNVNPVLATTFDLPSVGSKGGLLLVDSHFDPLRRQGEAAQKDPSVLDNLPSRPQSSNAAFTPQPTYPFTECLGDLPGEPPLAAYCTQYPAQAPVGQFTDAETWYPGIENRGADFFLRDGDASVVLPSRDSRPYSTRIVDSDGVELPGLFGQELAIAGPDVRIRLGSGDPADGDFDPANGAENLSLGVRLAVEQVAGNDAVALIRVRPAQLLLP